MTILAGHRLLLRTEANPRIGLGHLMRCVSLGQAWQDAGGQVELATTSDLSAIQTWLETERIAVSALPVGAVGADEDAERTGSRAGRLGAAWVVVDGYDFSPAYHRRLKSFGRPVLLWDDLGGAPRYWSDIVLNQNAHAHEALYRDREPATKLLLGSAYVVLRREFLSWRDRPRTIPSVARHVLITLGGGDPSNLTGLALEGLAMLDHDIDARVVVGGLSPHREAWQAVIDRRRLPARLLTRVTAMAELMAWADVCVTGGGSTCWELCFMGVPHLVIATAENQRPIADAVHAAGAGISLGWHAELRPAAIADALRRLCDDADARGAMADQGRRLVTGEGRTRVVEAMAAAVLAAR